MATLRDELAEKTKAKIIELFGPESALAQAMEDDDFLEKLAQLVAWIYGEIMLSQSRPEPEYPTVPGPRYPEWPVYRKVRKPGMWDTGGPWETQHGKYTTAIPGSFIHKLWTSMSKYEGD